MHKTILRGLPVAALLVAATMTPASAADMYSEARSLKDGPALMPVARWHGFYGGVNAGYGWSDVQVSGLADGQFTADYKNFLNDHLNTNLFGDGFLGGVQVGYNLQYRALVVGIEADYDFGSVTASRNTGFMANPSQSRFQEEVKSQGFGTVRGRVGGAFGNLLVYGTGGLAVTTVDFSRRVDSAWGPGNTIAGEPASERRLGWTVGGGVEYALDSAWSFKAEYLHADFGSVANRIVGGPVGIPLGIIDSEASVKMDVVRAGLNYKFGARDEALK